MNPPSIFNWDRIGRALKKGRGPEKMPLQSTFDEIATAYFKEVIWKDKKVSLHDQLRDCREMLEHSEYAWADVPTEDDHTPETAKTKNIMLVEVAVRRTFFRLCQSWIKERMEMAGVSEGTENPGVLEGTESHPGTEVIPTNDNACTSAEDHGFDTGCDDWVLVEGVSC